MAWDQGQNIMPLIQLVYASAATKPFTQTELRELLSRARANNGKEGITGLLLYHKLSFLQILEGEEENVAPLFARIERDPRHNRVLLLSRKDTEERNFSVWSMGFIDVNQTAAALSGFVKLLEAKASFLDLQGDSKLVAKVIDGFQEGQWRQSIGH
jgi:hypothetical protein